MATHRGIVVHARVLLCVALSLSLAAAITLTPPDASPRSRGGGRTQRPTGTAPTPVSPAPPEAHTEEPSLSVYRLKSSKGVTCILIETDGLIEVSYNDHGEQRSITEYMPDAVTVEGNCEDEDIAKMSIKWPGHKLLWLFGKTPGREGWFIKSIELIIESSLAKYKDMHVSGKTFTLAHRKMLIPTPTAKSYACSESIFDLAPDKDDTETVGITGKLFLRSFRLQPFMFKEDKFGPPFDCNTEVTFRDETAPIAVGSTLAVAVLATVTGYGVFRYFKIKKVQYNTMG